MPWTKFIAVLSLGLLTAPAWAEPPVASYIFPAGGQLGTTVNLRIGGLFLHKSCAFEMLGSGIEATKKLTPMATLWFEGPLLPLPDSQRQEDYPKDMAGQVKIAADAPLGLRYWRLATSQGATPALKFIVGDLPEIVEQEIDGDPIPAHVKLPVTINGRIFPRANVDVWTFEGKKGQPITCEVNAQRLGSPLEAHFEVLDPQGKRLAEGEPLGGGDSRLRFTPPADGKYPLRIHDINFHGSQSHVYRLTVSADPFVDGVFPLGGKRGSKVAFEGAGQGLPQKMTLVVPKERGPWAYERLEQSGKISNAFLLDLDDLDEHLETPGQIKEVIVPAVCNGRIAQPGEIDGWQVSLQKGEALEAELRAARLSSALDGVLSVVDAAGKELARADTPAADLNDPVLRFTPSADGKYTVRVQDRFRSRGGPAFAYRLRLTKSAEPDFRLRLPVNAVTLLRGGKGQIQVFVDRQSNFPEPVTLTVDGLPKGVTAKWNEVGKGASTTINLETGKEVAIQACRLTIRGTAKPGTKTLTRTAVMPAPFGQPAIDSVLLAVAVPVPFKVKGEYVMRWAARGSVYTRKYQIDRTGFDGPLQISLADRQARHLQGVFGPSITVPAGATEFEYAVHLPPWMETGRTSRTCVMAVGVLKDKDGSEHEVSFSSIQPNEQLVAVVEPARLGINLERASLAAFPGKSLTLPFQVSRSQKLTGPVTVELVVASHLKGISAQPVTLAKDQSKGNLAIRCADPLLGPFNMPLVVRATLLDNGRPVVAEARVEVTLEK